MRRSCCPAAHQGGALGIEHGDERLSVAGDGAATWRYAAGYADCRHRLEPVTEGVRSAMTFGVAIDPGRAGAAKEAKDRAFRWALYRRSFTEGHARCGARGARVAPGAAQYGLKTVWVLKHRYTVPGLRPSLLKGP